VHSEALVLLTTDAEWARITHLEGAFDQMDKRLGSVEARLGSVETRLGSLEHQVHDFRLEVQADFRDLRVEMRERFRWVLGLLVVAILSPAVLRLLGR